MKSKNFLTALGKGGRVFGSPDKAKEGAKRNSNTLRESDEKKGTNAERNGNSIERKEVVGRAPAIQSQRDSAAGRGSEGL